MKKIMFLFFIILFLPLNIFAYSKNIIPGGESIGIEINSNGLIVVGFYKVNGKYIARENIEIGDVITKINGIEVNSINELTNLVNDNLGNSINLEILRHNKIYNTKLNIEKDNNVYKTGLYVKGSVVGLGTLTYIDPITKIYGALGHEIKLNETNRIVEVKDGNILLSKINKIDKSRNGRVGSKDATIIYNKVIGDIKKNTNKGLFGLYTAELPNKETMKIGEFDDIKKGNAYILTVTSNDKVERYNINILDKYSSGKNTGTAFSFEVIDKSLINISGGIVQGMSGSPIIQNNMIIGAVTNVVIDDVKFGYGISIVTMLEEGDKIK